MNLRLIAPALLGAVAARKNPAHTPPSRIQTLQDQRRQRAQIGIDDLRQ
jgi:hypothetical protein